ncbi:MAG TPA: hypothetical protein VF526_22775 [Solirubrobacteraceae bacterium]|jgi:hypothetical protein
MKVFPVVVLVLLAFAAFFMTFLIAPLAVLTIFYVIYAARTSSSAAAPAAPPEPHLRWATQPEPEPVAPPARRARLTVVSSSGDAAHDVAAADGSGTPLGSPSPSPNNDTSTLNDRQS